MPSIQASHGFGFEKALSIFLFVLIFFTLVFLYSSVIVGFIHNGFHHSKLENYSLLACATSVLSSRMLKCGFNEHPTLCVS